MGSATDAIFITQTPVFLAISGFRPFGPGIPAGMRANR
jgi:hypothetical protein